jgi:DNA-binding transcriptional LysR family regulator
VHDGAPVDAARDYFAGRAQPAGIQDLKDELWCGYIQELLFTEVLDMMTFDGTTIVPRYRTTSVTAQVHAALSGQALAILPTFMAAQYPALVPVLADAVRIEMPYWMQVHSDLARSPRVRAVMAAIERLVEQDRALFRPAG